jgi:hypothetical protein
MALRSAGGIYRLAGAGIIRRAAQGEHMHAKERACGRPRFPTLDAAAASLRGCRSKNECLVRAYDLLSHVYYGSRAKTIMRASDLLRSRDPERLWERSGFLHCTRINILLRALLLRSGHFREEDIGLRWTLIGCCSPHQYVRVKVARGRRADVDIWARRYGIPFGESAHGFRGRLFAQERISDGRLI